MPDDSGHVSVVAFFEKYCISCHSGEKAKGELDLKFKLPNDFFDRAGAEKWKEVVNVLNGHEMPPKKEKQPGAGEVAKVVEWITAQTVKAEGLRKEQNVVLRRLNREEYRNTIRDLVGVDFDVSGFPQDPPAGGFDNNGKALAMSPMQMELYLHAARSIVDKALVTGEKPETIRWRFDPVPGAMDRRRIKVGPNNAIVNGGDINTKEGPYTVLRVHAWNRGVNARDFKVPVAGMYRVSLHAAKSVPSRQQVVESARAILKRRNEQQNEQNPKGKKWNDEAFERDLKHFEKDRMYDYGPPRIKVVQQLGSQPRSVAEFDIEGTVESPKVQQFTTYFTTESAGLSFEYAYSIPAVLENFWMQGKDEFARPAALIDWFEIEGPIHETWPPPSHQKLLFESPLRGKNDRGYAQEVLARFMKQAYRRPVTAEEVEKKMKFYEKGRKDGLTAMEAMKLSLVAVLTSPNFLYLSEPATEVRKLTQHELASRLSYFLWSTMPDDGLMKLADAGKLGEKAVVLAEVDRMLKDPKAAAFTRNFAGQWLGLREVGLNPPAPDLYPQYDRHLETSIIREAEAFFEEILRNDLSVNNFIKSDFVVINERLARFYCIDGVRGDAFRKVPVPSTIQRGGIVTQAAMLSITSNGTRTSPVKRGTWVLKNLFGADPGLPVANVGEIAAKLPGIEKATLRKRLEFHRTRDQCARCHNKIDPLGLALENYNAAGEWREQEGFGYKGRVERNDPKIDAAATMPDGSPIVGVGGLQDALLKKQEQFHQCLAAKLLTYALGREVGLADQPIVKAACSSMKQNGMTMRSLIHFIVTTDVFQTK